jgi:ribonucleoside-diphosphate reductase beta chain
MEKSIINTQNDGNNNKIKMFFDEQGLGVQRYDNPKYPKIFNMFKQQLSYFWRPEEINITKDKSDFQNLPDYQQELFTLNLKYQILLDTIQSRGISHLLEHCTNPEIEAFAKSWEFMETLHSYSYTYIIKQIYSDPSKVLDTVLTDEKILKRASSVTKYYDDMINSIPDDSDYNKKKKLYLTLVSINILEGIRFYVSFACSFAFAQNKKMTGNAKIISLIARDENLHMGFSSLILKYMKEDPDEGFQDIVNECESIVYKMYKDAAEEEMEWARYLFKDGSMIGLNADILIDYMKYLTNNRLKTIKMEPIFDKVKNPISWIGNWIGGNTVQEAPQEEEIISYTVGAIKQDVEDQDFSGFDI